jgi:hypothetical protein
MISDDRAAGQQASVGLISGNRWAPGEGGIIVVDILNENDYYLDSHQGINDK